MNERDLNESVDDAGADRPEERKTVTVNCAHANGLMLRLYQNHDHDDKDAKPAYETVDLKGGGNQVDARFMECWQKENPDSDLVRNGTVVIIDPEEERKRAEGEGGKPGEDNIVERPEKESSIDAPAPKQDGEDDGEKKSPGNEPTAA